MPPSPVSGILSRNLGAVRPGERVLWINPSPGDPWRMVAGAARRLDLFCQDYAAWLALESAGAVFGDFPATDAPRPDHCILALPHGKARLEMMLDLAGSLLCASGRLWLAGENQAGIKSCAGRLAARFGGVRKVDNARHCVLFEATGVTRGSRFDPRDYCLEWVTEHSPGGLRIRSWPGVFAHGRLDEGTDLLLQSLAQTSVGPQVLDFACGSGVIGASIASLNPGARVTMLDADAVALRAARETMAANGLVAEVIPGDGLRGLSGRFDTIVSNPPFHRGAHTDMRLGMQILDPVGNFLRPRGQFIMVANRHLPYREWLGRQFGGCEVLASNDRFQVLRAARAN